MRIRKQFNDGYCSRDYSTQLESGCITQQNLKDKCDVNKIISRYVKTGVMDHIKENKPFYGDVVGFDYRDAQDKVLRAQSAFNALPANVRKLMDNDPAKFVEWMSSTDDLELKQELGLVDLHQEPAKPTLSKKEGAVRGADADVEKKDKGFAQGKAGNNDANPSGKSRLGAE